MSTSPEYREVVDLPAGVSADITKDGFTIKGKNGQVTRAVHTPQLQIVYEGQKLVFAAKGSKREKKILMSLAAHARNMAKGVVAGHLYKLKICSGHFPMNVVVSGTTLSIKNFLGEKFPRTLTLRNGVKVEVKGQEIVVTSHDLELAGQTAADIEKLTKITRRDRRIFQDGIFITMKDGEELA